MCSDLKGKEKKDLLVLINLCGNEDASEDSHNNLAVHIEKENDPIHYFFYHPSEDSYGFFHAPKFS